MKVNRSDMQHFGGTQWKSSVCLLFSYIHPVPSLIPLISLFSPPCSSVPKPTPHSFTCGRHRASQTEPAAVDHLCACMAWCCRSHRCSHCRHCPLGPGTCWSCPEPGTASQMGVLSQEERDSGFAAASSMQTRPWQQSGAAARLGSACWKPSVGDVAGPEMGCKWNLRSFWCLPQDWNERRLVRPQSAVVDGPVWAPVSTDKQRGDMLLTHTVWRTRAQVCLSEDWQYCL